MPLCDVLLLNTLCLASCTLTYRAQHARHGQRPHLNGNAKLTCVVTQSGLKPLKTRCLFSSPCKSFIRLQSKGFYLIKAELETGRTMSTPKSLGSAYKGTRVTQQVKLI